MVSFWIYVTTYFKISAASVTYHTDSYNSSSRGAHNIY